MEKTQAIILAGGSGNRFGGILPKQFIKIAGKTVIEHTVECFERHHLIDSILIVINPEFYDFMNEILLRNNFNKVKKVLRGGNTRQESSYIGINGCDEDTGFVLFHDAVRPFVSERIITDMIEALKEYEAVDVAIPAADTIIKVNDEKIIEDIPKRQYLMRGQTPQGFRLSLIKKAYEIYMKNPDIPLTDDCGLIVKYNLAPVYVVQGEEKNIKITYPEDVFMADKLFQVNSISSLEIAKDNEQYIKHLKDRVIVVFGYSSGIGKEIYNMAKSYGAIVYGFSRSNGVDVSNYTQVKESLDQVYKKEGKINDIINTTGILGISKLQGMKQEDIIEQVQTNYIGSINVTKAGIPYLKETKGSVILFTSSSYTRGRAMYSIYSSTKAAVVNFTQAMGEELYQERIRINVINPERTKTPMRIKNFGYEKEDTLLSPKQVAIAAIDTILSDITGQVIDVRRNMPNKP
ncbi:MAG: ribitol-5-phosphate 2-dehydrogenase / D-ribitol-5-phosphate cytidylyltransferase [Epulopiscium sp.]|nr:ribitol-5-phosphate 2-dehydrogenase / D-ribitol-5-phosphate cytidylyltransferase [Candidatus Epulonipiscium sp.]